MDILKKLQEELNIKASQVENTVKLLDEGKHIHLWKATSNRSFHEG